MTEITAKYRVLFCNPDNPIGQEVWSDLMLMLGFGKPVNPDDAFAIAAHNLALALWARLGTFSEENRQEVISAVMAVPPRN